MDRTKRPARRPAEKASSSNPLVCDFGSRSKVSRAAVAFLYQGLVEGQPSSRAAMAEWSRLVADRGGHASEGRGTGIEQLARRLGIARQGLMPQELLFSVQTYYAMVIEALLRRMVAYPAAVDVPRLFKWYRSPKNGVTEVRHRDRLSAITPGRGRPISTGTTGIPLLGGAPAQSLCQSVLQAAAEGRDVLGGLYEDLFPKQLRHALGEHYTPRWLAGHVLDCVGYFGQPGARLLDPACGSGSFLVSAIRRIRRWCDPRGNFGPGEQLRHILTAVVGFDLHPLAVLSARANYLLAVSDLIEQVEQVEIPIFLRDSILAEDDEPRAGTFDYVVGNPPWIAWDHLPAATREATKPLWQQYGLFTLSGKQARHGGGKKDLSMLMLYTAADRYLQNGGKLGFVISQTVFQTKGAGDGFRRFRLGESGPCLRVLLAGDMADFQPFATAANWTGTVVLEKGSPTVYPVPYVRWSVHGDASGIDDEDGCPALSARRYYAEPVDRARPTSPWFLRPEGFDVRLDQLTGPSDYQAHLGANSGGANGVYWVDVLCRAQGGVHVRNLVGKGKEAVDAVEDVIEPGLLYPLVRWADVGRFRAAASHHLLLCQDAHTRQGIAEEVMRVQYPRTYAYLKRFEGHLVRRAAYRRYQQSAPFYSMYNVGRHTLAPVKVIWRRMDRRMNAAVVEAIDDPVLGLRPIIPQETCVLIAVASSEEAHYVCSVLNSAIVSFLVASHSVRGGKGFGTPSVLDYLRLRRYDPDDLRHQELSALSRRARRAAIRGEELATIQERVDLVSGELWQLEARQIEVIRRG